LKNPNFAILDEDPLSALFNNPIQCVSPDFPKNNNHPNIRVFYEIMSFSRSRMRIAANAIEEQHSHMADHGGMLKLLIARDQLIRAK
jgi:hypothetical protein